MFAGLIHQVRTFGRHTDAGSEREVLRRRWDATRAAALTPSERAEIDAIFSRQMR